MSQLTRDSALDRAATVLAEAELRAGSEHAHQLVQVAEAWISIAQLLDT